MKADYYVGIEDHKLLRKNLLESVKGTIKILQRLELIKRKREEKIEKITQLKRLAEEINFTIQNLKKIMPKADKPKPIKAKGEDKPAKKISRKVAKKVTKKASKKTKSAKKAVKKVVNKAEALGKKKVDEGQTTIKDSSIMDLKSLAHELDDIESKLKDLK